MKYFLKHITELSWLMGIILSVMAILVWVPIFLSMDSFSWEILFTLFLSIGNSVFLMHLFYEVGISRIRSPLPIFCYLICQVPLVILAAVRWEGQILVLGMQIILLILIHAYHSERAVHESFMGTLLICFISLIVPDVIFFLPILWIALGVQRAFNLRVLLSSLTAASVFALYLTIFTYFFPDTINFLGFIDTFWHYLPEMDDLIIPLVYASIAFFFGVLSMTNFVRENAKAQSFILIILLVLLLSGILMFFPPAHFPSLLDLTVFSLATLSAYCFSSQHSVFRGIVFIVYILLFVAVYVLRIFAIF